MVVAKWFFFLFFWAGRFKHISYSFYRNKKNHHSNGRFKHITQKKVYLLQFQKHSSKFRITTTTGSLHSKLLPNHHITSSLYQCLHKFEQISNKNHARNIFKRTRQLKVSNRAKTKE